MAEEGRSWAMNPDRTKKESHTKKCQRQDNVGEIISRAVGVRENSGE